MIYVKNNLPSNSSENSRVFGPKRTALAGLGSELVSCIPSAFADNEKISSFRILITGGTSGLVETITDAVSIHSIKKAEYSKRLAEGRFGHVTLLDYFKSVSPPR